MSEQILLKRLAEFKKKLRLLSKNNLIRSYVGQYAETVKLTVQNEQLLKQIKALQPEKQGE